MKPYPRDDSIIKHSEDNSIIIVKLPNSFQNILLTAAIAGWLSCFACWVLQFAGSMSNMVPLAPSVSSNSTFKQKLFYNLVSFFVSLGHILFVSIY